jgi:hypothetical protein
MEREAMIPVEFPQHRDGRITGLLAFKAGSVQRAPLHELKIAINKMGCFVRMHI